MKKIIIALLAGLLAGVFAAGSALALDLEVSGEIKTGFFFEQIERGGKIDSHSRIHNNDLDSGLADGRIRLNFALQADYFGIRTQFFQDQFLRGTGVDDTNVPRVWMYFAYAYANMFENQLKISAGLLGESPWGTGGPELFQELEYAGGEPLTGIRTEWKPNFGFLRGLNLGFVLNRPDGTPPGDAKEQFGGLFMESILGIAWEHDYFAFRFAYRFDQDVDSPMANVDGEKLAYRVEERILGKLLPGMSIWANGYSQGINAQGRGSGRTIPGYAQHWFYASYDPEYFTAGLNIGYKDGFVLDEQLLEFKPSFYYKLFNDLLRVGLMGGIEMGFNNGKSFEDAFYNSWFLEPQIKVNIINRNLYAAVVYRYTSGVYRTETATYPFKDQDTHWVNLRICYTF